MQVCVSLVHSKTGDEIAATQFQWPHAPLLWGNGVSPSIHPPPDLPQMQTSPITHAYSQEPRQFHAAATTQSPLRSRAPIPLRSSPPSTLPTACVGRERWYASGPRGHEPLAYSMVVLPSLRDPLLPHPPSAHDWFRESLAGSRAMPGQHVAVALLHCCIVEAASRPGHARKVEPKDSPRRVRQGPNPGARAKRESTAGLAGEDRGVRAPDSRGLPFPPPTSPLFLLPPSFPLYPPLLSGWSRVPSPLADSAASRSEGWEGLRWDSMGHKPRRALKRRKINPLSPSGPPHSRSSCFPEVGRGNVTRQRPSHGGLFPAAALACAGPCPLTRPVRTE